MQKFLEWLDRLAGIEAESAFPKLLERTAFLFLIIMILASPHSIAATQIAWGIGMLAWLVRLFFKPRPRLARTPLDAALWAFLGWSIISAVCSYAPDISLDRLRNVFLFLIFYFVINNLRNARAVKFLAWALIVSCMFNVLWTPVERIFGRGVEVSGLSAESPLLKGKITDGATIADGDTIIEVNKKKIRTPESLLAEIEKNETSQVTYYRPDYNSTVEVKRADLLGGETALERLGIGSWKHSRVWRSAGFYSHYTTYAEVLQLIASLAFGLFIALEKKRSRLGAFLIFCILGMAFALLLTVTRGAQLGFLVSAFAIVLANGNRKMLLTLAAIVLPVALVGLIFLQQSRKVGFFDPNDDSTKWRQTVWREGFNLWTESPRHFFLGVGMDSIQRYAKQWHLFDDGRLPMGHFHSVPLQLVVERGLPALLLWLWILWIYAKILLRGIKFQIPDSRFQVSNPQSAIRNPYSERGVILGYFGGLIGFIIGGLVNNSVGNAVVMMMFFLLMGLSVSLVMQNAKLKMQNV